MVLSKNEINAYQESGLIFPKRILSIDEASGYLAELESYESDTGGPVSGKWRYKSHLVFPWINRLMRDPRMLALAQSVLGEDLMVWTTHLYPKEAGDYEIWESLAPTLMPILKEELGEIFLPWTSAVTESMQKQEKEVCVMLKGKEFKHSLGGPQKYHVKSLAILRKKYESFKDNKTLTNILSEANCLKYLS